MRRCESQYDLPREDYVICTSLLLLSRVVPQNMIGALLRVRENLRLSVDRRGYALTHVPFMHSMYVIRSIAILVATCRDMQDFESNLHNESKAIYT